MTEETVKAPEAKIETPEGVSIYEIAYHALSTLAEDEVEKVTASIRDLVEKAKGSFVAEGAAQLVTLAYPIAINSGGKNTVYDRAYFGWIKCEMPTEEIEALQKALESHKQILRFMVIKTVREDTRASAQMVSGGSLKEVKRGGTIKAKTSKTAEQETAEKGELSEEKLDKALDEMTNEA